MSGWELFEIWLIAFFTLALFSFMYKDNPVYKIAEHIFAGLTAGYQVGLIWDTVIIQQLWDPMLGGKWWLLIPGIMGFLMFARFFQKYSWISRVSLAFVMGVTAGIFLISQLHGLVLPQMKNTMHVNSEKIAVINNVTIDDTSAEFTKYNELTSALVPKITQMTADSLAVNPAYNPATDSSLAGTIQMEVEQLSTDSMFNIKPFMRTDFPPELEQPLTATFVPDGELGLLEYYSPVCTLFNQYNNKKIFLGRYEFYDKAGFEMIETDPSLIKVEYNPVTIDAVPAGVYTVKLGVEKRSVMLLLTIIIVIGVISTLIYFYFSHEHKGALGVTAQVGIWFIMISFGAHFGYTVMGRVSLLIGRVQFLVEDWIGSFNQLF